MRLPLGIAGGLALVGATLLVVDAWFDVMTSHRGVELYEAVAMALVVEIPAALFSLWLARRVNRNALQLAVHLDDHHRAE